MPFKGLIKSCKGEVRRQQPMRNCLGVVQQACKGEVRRQQALGPTFEPFKRSLRACKSLEGI